MAKNLIVVGREGERVPFLRGILTRSLQAVGLSFEDSYNLASVIRSELASVAEVESVELRRRVLQHLEPFGQDVILRYERAPHATPTILVRDDDGQLAPFSRGRHRVRLESSGLSIEQATSAAVAIHDVLADRGDLEVEAETLRQLTYDHLAGELGAEAARRFLLIEKFYDSDRPLLILIGGSAGCGKSTIASLLAHLLEIVRTQSTDMLREVMRMMIPERLLPVVHVSSFKAWELLPGKSRTTEDLDAQLIDGYLTQAELVSVACEAVIQRALQERVSLILDGVHVHPGLLERIPADTDAIVVPLMVAVLSPGRLRKRIRGRGRQEPDRRARRYLENFDRIWGLQSFLLSEADRAGVPIIANDDKYRAAQQAVGCILDALSRNFEVPDPDLPPSPGPAGQ